MKKIIIPVFLVVLATSLLFMSAKKVQPELTKESPAIAGVYAEKIAGNVVYLMSLDKVKEIYKANIAEHFFKTAELRGIELEDIDMDRVYLGGEGILEGKKVSHMTFVAEHEGMTLTIAIPIFNGTSDNKFYLSRSEANGGQVPDGESFECACETHACAGVNCSGCNFSKDANDCVTGCTCNFNSGGGGRCDHTRTQLPPGSCTPF